MQSLDIDRTDVEDADELIQAASAGRLARWERRVSASADRMTESLRNREYAPVFCGHLLSRLPKTLLVRRDIHSLPVPSAGHTIPVGRAEARRGFEPSPGLFIHTIFRILVR